MVIFALSHVGLVVVYIYDVGAGYLFAVVGCYESDRIGYNGLDFGHSVSGK